MWKGDVDCDYWQICWLWIVMISTWLESWELVEPPHIYIGKRSFTISRQGPSSPARSNCRASASVGVSIYTSQKPPTFDESLPEHLEYQPLFPHQRNDSRSEIYDAIRFMFYNYPSASTPDPLIPHHHILNPPQSTPFPFLDDQEARGGLGL